MVGALLGKIPTPGYVVFSSTKSFVSTLGQGLSFELEGLGVDVLTYNPGFMERPNSQFLNKWWARLLADSSMSCARVALAEMEMSPYGEGCGSNLIFSIIENLLKVKKSAP